MDILIKDNVFDNVDEIRQQGLDRTDYEYRDQPCAPGWKGYRSWFNEDEGDIICQQIINLDYDIEKVKYRNKNSKLNKFIFGGHFFPPVFPYLFVFVLTF